MKRVVCFLCAIVTVASSARALAAVTTNISVPIDQIVFNPCADNRSGENISLSGPLHVLTSVTLTKDSVHLDTHFQPQDVTGVGSVTGTTYRATGVTRENTTFHGAGFPFIDTFVNNFRMIGRSSASNFMVHVVFHITVNANGVTTAVPEHVSVDCR
jgi:hypothetical protein